MRLLAHAAVPTSHAANAGIAEGVADALRGLLEELGEARGRVALVAFSTTQAMNALLEGDVGRVGVLGIGAAPDLRAARKRAQVESVALAPGHALETEHAFLDATGGLDRARRRLRARRFRAGCVAVAVSGALAVDDPEAELLAGRRAHAPGCLCASATTSRGAYGLEMRTVSAAVNASILPVVERTAAVVEEALKRAGPPSAAARAPGRRRRQVRRGLPQAAPCSRSAPGPPRRRRCLPRLRPSDAIVIECGGTGSNISIVKRGRPVVRSLG